MSVPKPERNPSEADFLQVVRAIAHKTLDIAKQIPKTYTFDLRNPLVSCMWRCFELVRDGNGLYPTSYKEAEDRLLCFKRAKAKLYTLSGYLEVIEERASSNVSSSDLKEISGLIGREIKLLIGIIESDKKRYQQRFGMVKQSTEE